MVRPPPGNAGVHLYQKDGTKLFSMRESLPYSCPMETVRIGYARCSTDRQDLTAQRLALIDLGVDPERIYTDHGLTGRTRARPGLDQAVDVPEPSVPAKPELRQRHVGRRPAQVRSHVSDAANGELEQVDALPPATARPSSSASSMPSRCAPCAQASVWAVASP